MNWLERATAAGVDGFLHPNELEKLVELATGRDVLEIGSFKGLSAWGMSHTALNVVCIDTFKANSAGQFQQDDYTTLADFDRNLAGKTNVTRLPYSSERAFELLPDSGNAASHFDMIFLDAMHDYSSVKADIERWWPRLKIGGVLALHDYAHWDFPGVQQAADEIFGPAPEGTTTVTLRWIEKT